MRSATLRHMARNKPKEHASFRMVDTLKLKLAAIALTERRTLSQVIRMALEDFVARKAKEQEQAQ